MNKKSIWRISLLCIVLIAFGNSACMDNFEEINTDPNRLQKISPGTLLNPILYGMASFNTSKSDDFTFNVMQVALPYPSVSGGVHRYDITETAGNSTWNNYYRWLANIKEMREVSIAAQDPNYEAVALTLNAWVYSQLSDCFGDVPMDEAVRGEEGILKPVFNTQQEVYTKIIADLERANTLFDVSKPMIYGADILYSSTAAETDKGKNIAKWRMFCNSLRLRLLLRVSKRAEMDAFTKLSVMIGDPAKYPVFTNNSEAAILKVSGVGANLSPWGRAIDFTTFRAGSQFFIDNLNNFNDPRRAVFNTQARTKDGKTQIGYKGIPSAYTGSDSQFDFLPSNLNVALVTAPMVCVIMTYAEVEFIKAELALNGVIASDPKTHYENGVKASIEQWGAVMPVDYFANEAAAYDGTIERIMLQKYYALYFNDFQQWFEYRRTGLPVLPTTDAMLNDKRVPVRFKYPLVVRTNNPDNYAKAVATFGTDDINTKGWWEK
ncbi:SusD/RagB family nutrient-binding outer membrane lipoprotein [Pseudochryseolinea flava]|uniref:SusD/RagB family nutrient-binding outer membrane lipoprotein n=1 Tax=Pseudochryseolinea flava TaxID=2059302 RepID=A0A364Y7S3_9BACT|nr:SusD/RagB family nutrient-binding outer membrane lipoprotein [Pseudochryseolinea flava]RAW02437.1 SusD/RagB family nutrient-binding outer membrane lipoprotein [Pseudochryseolinea flava]